MIHIELGHRLSGLLCFLEPATFLVKILDFFSLVLNFTSCWLGRVLLHIIRVLSSGGLLGYATFQNLISIYAKLQFSSGVRSGLELGIPSGCVVGVNIIVFSDTDVIVRGNIVIFDMGQDGLF